jgi:hypothetical protein
MKRLALADDAEPADGTFVMSYGQASTAALKAARAWRRARKN